MILRKPWKAGLMASVAGLVLITATDARSETLNEALAQAYATNPTLQAQRAKLRATDEQVPQAISNWRPTVTMSGSLGTSSNKTNLSSPPNRSQHRDPRSASLTLSQPLFRGLRTVAATDAAKNNVQAERARLISTEQSVLLDAAVAYMNVVRDEAVLDLNRNNEEVLRRQLEATRDRFEVGEITRTDVHQAEARLAGAMANRIAAEGALETSKATYASVIGVPPQGLSQPADPAGLPEGRDAAMDMAIQSNPSVVAADFDARAARDSARQVRGELLPVLSLDGTASRAFDTAGEHSRLDTYEAKLNLTVPLYQKGAVYSRLRQARQTAAQQNENLAQARRSAGESAARSWEDLAAARARIESFKAQINANQVALDGVQREAMVGSRTVLDVLDAEQELLDSKVNLVRAERDAQVAAHQLLSAVGGLTAQGLGLPVDLYDFERHYQEVRGKWVGGSSSGDINDTGGQ